MGRAGVDSGTFGPLRDRAGSTGGGPSRYWPPVPKRPRASVAMTAAWMRRSTPSSASSREMWFLTVFSARWSR